MQAQTNPHPPLSRVLLLDAVTCAAMGLLLVALAGTIAAITAIPEPLLWWAGALLFPVALLIFITWRIRPSPYGMVAFIIVGNIGWTLASVILAFSSIIQPNMLGTGFLLGQALVVIGFIIAEIRALRAPIPA
ncbi:hypothetical protein CHU95_04020 [Niveispirillum lacus]|uniref:Uncharacterized protein n=1 Tax=Niveispirillum lacus TaxID=1981099 RepID=A0A255Z4N7_9PROT|nr:hypothetical protein [Niveispirillum lacus]OYQ36409.1 hypothetical protein CHU95_04020 [Niveispirillum lacus]